jgi:hypothetical protein
VASAEAQVVAPVSVVEAEPGVSEAAQVVVVPVSPQAALDETAVGARRAWVEPGEPAAVQAVAVAAEVEQAEHPVVVVELAWSPAEQDEHLAAAAELVLSQVAPD